MAAFYGRSYSTQEDKTTPSQRIYPSIERKDIHHLLPKSFSRIPVVPHLIPVRELMGLKKFPNGCFTLKNYRVKAVEHHFKPPEQFLMRMNSVSLWCNIAQNSQVSQPIQIFINHFMDCTYGLKHLRIHLLCL
ncbi:hypothetical protein [Brevibacillus massiliensis]|uniref:hypothetical protein n=1 Tax=Brevibacillus massiliensis TaxID=1118054 RepID=UPI0011CAB364|nr:hypothetical protein [Brevibacillus massiliensis]